MTTPRSLRGINSDENTLKGDRHQCPLFLSEASVLGYSFAKYLGWSTTGISRKSIAC